MNYIRPLLIFAVIASTIWFAKGHVPHREAGSPMETLYLHLMPEDLLTAEAMERHEHGAHGGHGEDDHGEVGELTGEHADETAQEHAAHADHGDDASDYLLAFTVPGAPAFFDMDRDPVMAGTQLVATNLQLFQLAAVLLIFICLQGVPRYLRTGQGDYTSRLFAGFSLWLRDDVVYSVMGKETGQRFLPLFLFFFFFILFMNMMGLLPWASTATANLWVTAGLAGITLGSMLICGMVAQGPIAYWKNLVPDVPLALWPLLFVVELMGVMIKPIALCIRLFANMTGGHLAVLSIMGLIFVFAELSPVVGWSVAPIAVGFTVFIMIIEFFVAMLQAFIFTQLSVIFVHASVHPDH